ncbi:hypothetical protein K449DRAFT_440025 [Hypoxylon sp. EC38]|nr:hypothetical protein K449DRAFT_440025 [Hypoxylon sp. EC38]
MPVLTDKKPGARPFDSCLSKMVILLFLVSKAAFNFEIIVAEDEGDVKDDLKPEAKDEYEGKDEAKNRAKDKDNE